MKLYFKKLMCADKEETSKGKAQMTVHYVVRDD